MRILCVSYDTRIPFNSYQIRIAISPRVVNSVDSVQAAPKFRIIGYIFSPVQSVWGFPRDLRSRLTLNCTEASHRINLK